MEPAPPGKDKVTFPHQNSFHTSTSPTSRRHERRPPGSIPPRMMWKSQPHWLIADQLGSCSSVGPRGDRFPSPDAKSFHTPTTHQPGTKTVMPRVDLGPHGEENPKSGMALWAGVREHGGPRPMGATRFSKFINHDLINPLLIPRYELVVHSTWIPIYNLCMAQIKQKI